MTRYPAAPSWASQLTTVGVTGTNGKTSTTLYLASALGAAPLGSAPPVAAVTTIGAFIGADRFDTSNDYNGFLRVMRSALDRGARHAAIELTSEALAAGFVHGWPCAHGVFTNLSRDHLDAHGSAEHYLASKAQLFMQLPRGGSAVLNAADPASPLLEEVLPPGVDVVRYAVDPADVAISWGGTTLEIASLGTLRVPNIGVVYAENALAAWTAAVAAGVDREIARDRLAATPAVVGRFEVLHAGEGPRAVVDYAHTPNAIARTLATARSLTSGRVILVFGAGGERDVDKRPLMGQAAMAADVVVVTNDNPRGEDPAAIAQAVGEGLRDHPEKHVELDRRAAIEAAVALADDDDTVLIAGRGHERHPLSDSDIARRALGLA